MDLREQERQRQKEHYEVILAGAGGQGLIVSAMLLGEGAVREGRNVVQTQSYGIAARGGESVSELIIDTEEILFQQVEEPDVVLALNETAFGRYEGRAGKGPLVIFDTTCLAERGENNFCGFPFTKLAAELGRPGAAALIALGAMVARTGIIRMDSLIAVVSDTFPDAAAGNVRALRLGENLIAQQLKPG